MTTWARAPDTAVVLITGNATESKGHGWWLNQYRPKGKTFSDATLQCYLDIVNYLSLVFSEGKDADSRADATLVLQNPAKSPADVIFDQHALGGVAQLRQRRRSRCRRRSTRSGGPASRQHLRGDDAAR